MGLFDIFTGQPGIDAANNNKALLQGTQNTVVSGNNATRDATNSTLGAGYSAANKNLAGGYDAATSAINNGANGALDYLGQGASGAVGALTANGGAYKPLTDLAASYGKGAGLYADALGVNGADGASRASAAFTSNPSYDYTLNAGLSAIDRRANAAGMLQGGNANRDAISFATNAANQNYGSWLDRLGGYNNLQLGATQGAATGNAGVNQSVANITNTEGQNQASVVGQQGGSLADLAKSYYGGLAGNDIGNASAIAGNTGNWQNANDAAMMNITPQIAGQNTAAANSQMAGSGNIWNAGLQLAKLAAGAGGGAAGGGGASAGGSSFMPSASFMNNSWGW